MKKLMFVAVLALAGVSFAAEEAAAEKNPAAEKKPAAVKRSGRMTKEKMAQMQMRSFGGYVRDTRQQRGSVVIVNVQKAADKEWFGPVVEELEKFVRLRFEVKDGTFDLAKPELKGEACVFVVDDPALPMSLVAPEAKWTMMNVAPLKSGSGEKPQYLKARVQKSLMRSLAYLMGAADSQYPMCLTKCITKPEDLDQFTDFRLPVDVVGKFHKNVEGYGVTPYARVSYKKSVEEGWGAQPTNDAQKAIWNAVHELPTNPLPLVKPAK